MALLTASLSSFPALKTTKATFTSVRVRNNNALSCISGKKGGGKHDALQCISGKKGGGKCPPLPPLATPLNMKVAVLTLKRA